MKEQIDLYDEGVDFANLSYSFCRFTLNLLHFQLVSFWLLSGGVSAQFHALRNGFSQLLDPSLLCIFGPAELDELFCGCGSSQGSQKNWSPTAIAQAIKPDHGSVCIYDY